MRSGAGKHVSEACVGTSGAEDGRSILCKCGLEWMVLT